VFKSLLRLWLLKGEKRKCKTSWAIWDLVSLARAYSASFVFDCGFIGLKKGKGCLMCVTYAFFLITNIITIPTIAIAMIMAMTAGTKYVSTAEVFSVIGAVVV
jgi:hypothetical protein